MGWLVSAIPNSNDPIASAELADGDSGVRPPDEAARRLWRLWRTGAPPDLHSFVNASGQLTADRLVAVAEVDQHERWRTGQPVPTEFYFEAFPILADDPRAFSLIL